MKYSSGILLFKVFIILKDLKFPLYYYVDIYIFKFSIVCVCMCDFQKQSSPFLSLLKEN